MAQYIDKSALVAEIKRRIKTNKECMLGLRNLDYYQGKIDALNDTLSSLDTLDVKEVDLNEEIESYFKGFGKFASVGIDDCIDIAKHFFELGLKAQKGKEV